VPLDELYALPAQRFIEARGGSVRCNARARVDLQAGPGVTLAGGERIDAAAVVIAVPWHAFGDVVATVPALEAVAARATALEASAIVTVNLWLDTPLDTGPFVGLPGRTFQWLFDKRALFGERFSHLSLVSSGASGITARSNDDLIVLAWSELRAAMPALRLASIRRAVVVRERTATFSVAPRTPPRPATITAVPGLFLAGDWIETMLPATIESAVASGHRAAEAVLAARRSSSS
jgi:hypothetical protein